MRFEQSLGFITIEAGGDRAQFPLDWFLEQEPDYEVAGDRRLYIPGQQHAVWSEPGNQGGGPLPWYMGDGYLAKLAQYQAQWAVDNPTPPPDPTPPDWTGLLTWFLQPGNTLYDSARDKAIATADFICLDRFSNLKLLITNPALWTEPGLANAIYQLAIAPDGHSLAALGQGLSVAEIDLWNGQIDAAGLNPICKLPGGTP